MTGARVQTAIWPRDAMDLALNVLHGVLLVVALNLVPALGVVAALRWLGFTVGTTDITFGVVYSAIAAGLLSVSVLHIRCEEHGLRFVRLIGAPRFIRWDDIVEVAPAPRSEVIRHGWLWPPWPPREATWSMTSLGHVRIMHVGGVTYLPPRDPSAFMQLMRSHGVAVREVAALERPA